MSSTSEKGHAKNVANFAKMIEFVSTYDKYKPYQKRIFIESLRAIYDKANASIEEVSTLVVNFNNSTNDRADLFDPLSVLTTRIINAFTSSDASERKIEDAKGFQRKIQGASSPKAKKPKAPDAPVPNEISSSQQSYDQKIMHFGSLIKTLKSEPSYKPNEEDLTVDALNGLLKEFKNTTTQLNKTLAAIKKVRLTRNKILYTPKTGLYDITMQVKTYVKGAYTATATEYKQLVKLAFTDEEL